MTILESLLAISSYPIPMRTVQKVAARRELEIDEDAESETLVSASYRLAEADLLMWLFLAPNVSQGGQSYSLTDAQRADFRRRAQAVYDELGGGDGSTGVRYGYKGENL